MGAICLDGGDYIFNYCRPFIESFLMNERVLIRYISKAGPVRYDSYRASAFYSVLRQGDLFEGMELVESVMFPPPENSMWRSPTADRAEQIKMLEGLLKPYFDRDI